MGVNLNNLHFNTGGITLNVNGKITLRNTVAEQDLQVSAEQLHLTGRQFSHGDIILIIREDSLLDNATLWSSNNILAIRTGSQLTSNTSKLIAGLGNMNETGEISLQSRDMTFHKTSLAGAVILIRSQESITQDNTSTFSGQQVSINGRQISLNAQLIAMTNLALDAHILGGKTTVISSQQDLNINLTGNSVWIGTMLANQGQLQGRNLNWSARHGIIQGGFLRRKRSTSTD